MIETRKLMDQEILELKQRDKCEDCTWLKITSRCDSCRLADGNSYFLPNLFSRKPQAIVPTESA